MLQNTCHAGGHESAGFVGVGLHDRRSRAQCMRGPVTQYARFERAVRGERLPLALLDFEATAGNARACSELGWCYP